MSFLPLLEQKASTILLNVFVRGMPKPQPRQRHFARRFGDKWCARSYDPGTAEGWKSCIAMAVQNHLPPKPHDFEMSVDVDFFLPRPQALMRKKDPAGNIWCSNHRLGDRDNLDKALLDCLTQCGFWADDSLAVDGRIRKFFVAKEAAPGAIAVTGARIKISAAPNESLSFDYEGL